MKKGILPIAPSKKIRLFQKNYNNLSALNKSLYQSSLTGEKKTIPVRIKKTFKDLGLFHLFTPSGLHMSSLFLLRLLPTGLLLLILSMIYFWLIPYSYFSLERVILFKIIFAISRKLKTPLNLEAVFIATLFLSVLTGNASKSPLSFLYSCLFWGTIIFFRDSKLKLILFLHLTLQLTSIFSHEKVYLSALIINPIASASFVTVFPLFVLNTLLGGLDSLNLLLNLFLEGWISSVIYLHKYTSFSSVELSPFFLGTSVILFLKDKYKLAILLLCLNIPQLNQMKRQNIRHEKLIINLGDRSELLKRKSNTFHYIDQKCLYKLGRVLCKKKPSNLGGPIF